MSGLVLPVAIRQRLLDMGNIQIQFGCVHLFGNLPVHLPCISGSASLVADPGFSLPLVLFYSSFFLLVKTFSVPSERFKLLVSCKYILLFFYIAIIRGNLQMQTEVKIIKQTFQNVDKKNCENQSLGIDDIML